MNGPAAVPAETGRPLFQLLAAGVVCWLLSAVAIIVWFFSTVPDPGLLGVAMPFYAWFMGYLPGGVVMLVYGAVQALRRRCTARTVFHAGFVYFLPVLGAVGMFQLFALGQPLSVQEGDLPMMYTAFGGPLFFLLYLVGLVAGYTRRDAPLRRAVLATVALPAGGLVVQAVLLAAYTVTAPHFEHRHALALKVERVEWRDPGLTVEVVVTAAEPVRALTHAFYRDWRGAGTGRGEPARSVELDGRALLNQEWTRAPIVLEPGAALRMRLTWDGLRTTSLDTRREVVLRFVAGEHYHSGKLVREFRLAVDPDAATLAALDSKLTPVTRGGKTGYADRTGKLVIPVRYDWADEFHEGVAAAREGRRWGYIDPAGRTVIEMRFDEAGRFSEGLAAVRVGEHMGYIDRRGELRIPPRFQQAHRFSEGLARVRIDGREGFIDPAGNIVIAPQWEWTLDFANGYAGVRIGERWGFIDRAGRLAIGPRFEAVQCCSEGRANVMVDGVWGYIDREGRFVTPLERP